MEETAIRLVRQYNTLRFDPTDRNPDYEVYVVWKCKTLQNWKFLLSTSLADGMYYELTYNGDKREWYLDAYNKWENLVLPPDAVQPSFAVSSSPAGDGPAVFHAQVVPDPASGGFCGCDMPVKE